jgi:hypothetical protein
MPAVEEHQMPLLFHKEVHQVRLVLFLLLDRDKVGNTVFQEIHESFQLFQQAELFLIDRVVP